MRTSLVMTLLAAALAVSGCTAVRIAGGAVVGAGQVALGAVDLVL